MLYADCRERENLTGNTLLHHRSACTDTCTHTHTNILTAYSHTHLDTATPTCIQPQPHPPGYSHTHLDTATYTWIQPHPPRYSHTHLYTATPTCTQPHPPVYNHTYVPAYKIAYHIGMSDNDLVAVLLLFRRGTMEVLPEGGLNSGTILEELLKKRQITHTVRSLSYVRSHIGRVGQWVASGTALKLQPC